MTSYDLCEDCGQRATVSLGSMGPTLAGKPGTSRQHRYCRPCAERHGVPKRESLPPKRQEGEGIKWDGLLRFYQFMEQQTSLSDPEQRSFARDAALQFRDFMNEAQPDTPPAELREVIDRIIKNTA